MTSKILPKYFVSQTIRLPIYVFDIGDQIDANIVKNICLESRKNYLTGRPDLVSQGWQSKYFKRTEGNLNNLIETVEEKVNITAGNVYKVDSYWFVVYNKLGSQKWHDHGESDISAVYYPEVGLEPSPIIFKNEPNNDLEIPVSNNKLIIFPSKLQHSVPVNDNNDLRIAIAFNLRMSRFNPFYLLA